MGYLFTAVTFKMMTKRLSYLKLISLGITITNICFGVLFATSILFDKVQGIGFSMSLVVCFLIGASSNAAQLSFFAMINFLSQTCISRFTVGTAVGGLTLTVIRIIMVGIFGPNSISLIPIIFYFSFAAMVNFLDLSLNVKFFKSKVYF